MEREEILTRLNELKSQLPVDGLDEITISEQAKRIEKARKDTERAERKIRELEEKLKSDDNYRSGLSSLYGKSIEENKRDLEDMIARSDRLAAEIIKNDRRLEVEKKNRELAEEYGDKKLIATLDSNIERLEKRVNKGNAELEELNASIEELRTAISNMENDNIVEDVTELKDVDKAEIARLKEEIKHASTESMLAEYNFATSLNDLITDVERGNITEEVIMAKLQEYKSRLPKQFLLRDAAVRSDEKIQLEDALSKYEPRLKELEEKLSSDDNYRGVLASRLKEIKESKQNDLDTYTDEIKTNGARIAEINNEIRKLEAANLAADRVIRERQKEMDALPSQNHPMRKHLRAEIERKNQEITRNMTAMHTLRSEKGMLSSNIDHLRALTKPLKLEIEKINKEIEEDAKKIDKSAQRLDKIERDELISGIEATKLRLSFIDYDISDTIDKLVGDLDKSIKTKKEEKTEEVVEEAPIPVEEKDDNVTPLVVGTGVTPLNGIIKQDEEGKNYIIIFGPNGEELIKVEIPKNVLVPVEEKEEKTEEIIEEVIEEAPIPVEEKEEPEEKGLIPVVGFEDASDELKEDAEKKGVIASLKNLGKKLKEKGKEALDWVKDHKKQLIAGGVILAGLLVGMRGCEGNARDLEEMPTAAFEDVVDMPTFDFDEIDEEKEEEAKTSNIATAKAEVKEDAVVEKEEAAPVEAETKDETVIVEETETKDDEMPTFDFDEKEEETEEVVEVVEEAPTDIEVVPETKEELPEIVLNPGEALVSDDGEYVYNDGGNIDANFGDDIIGAETNGEQINVTVENNDNASGGENGFDSGITEEDAKSFYESLGIPYEDTTIDNGNTNEEDELISEEFVPIGDFAGEIITETPITEQETPVVEPEAPEVAPELPEIVLNPGEALVNNAGEYVYNDGGNIEANFGEDIIGAETNGEQINVTVENNDVPAATDIGGEEDTFTNEDLTPDASENNMDSGISMEDASDFYRSLGLTPPEEMGGKTR